MIIRIIEIKISFSIVEKLKNIYNFKQFKNISLKFKAELLMRCIHFPQILLQSINQS